MVQRAKAALWMDLLADQIPFIFRASDDESLQDSVTHNNKKMSIIFISNFVTW